jgi:hypothetical protein
MKSGNRDRFAPIAELEVPEERPRALRARRRSRAYIQRA